MYEEFVRLFSRSCVSDYPLAKRSPFGVGGAAKVAAFPSTTDELKNMLLTVRGVYPYCVLGAATNVLFSDAGFDGVIIFTDKLNGIKLFGSSLRCECGAKMKDILRVCRDNSLSGLEFACGIPGSVGGMVAMNAGCYNKCFADVVSYVLAEGGAYNNTNCCFDYRSSKFQRGETVFEVGFRLKTGEIENIDAKIERFSYLRRRSQPKGRSCGSCFLNEGFFAGKVIDQAGLKGFRLGGARISEEHANFVLSDGGTAQDIYDLIKEVKRRVFVSSGITLNEEIKFIGEFQ